MPQKSKSQTGAEAQPSMVYLIRAAHGVSRLWAGFRFRKELFDLEEDFFIRLSNGAEVFLDRLPEKLADDSRIVVRQKPAPAGAVVVQIPDSIPAVEEA